MYDKVRMLVNKMIKINLEDVHRKNHAKLTSLNEEFVSLKRRVDIVELTTDTKIIATELKQLDKLIMCACRLTKDGNFDEEHICIMITKMIIYKNRLIDRLLELILQK